MEEVWGAGKQQVRNVWSNIGYWHLNQWLYTLVELCCWDLSQGELADRRERSWDNPDRRPSHADRRPSHADRRRCVSREMLHEKFLAGLPRSPNDREFQRLFEGERTFSLSRDEETWVEAAKLDGCYCLQTDVAPAKAFKETIHDRYKDLAQVEWAFRTSKTIHLEARPMYVRLAPRTRGHLFIVMLAYLIVQELAKCWRELEVTVEEGLDELNSLCTTRVTVKRREVLHNVPQPRQSVRRLLDAVQIVLPKSIADRGVHVSTRKKLAEQRLRH